MRKVFILTLFSFCLVLTLSATTSYVLSKPNPGQISTPSNPDPDEDEDEDEDENTSEDNKKNENTVADPGYTDQRYQKTNNSQYDNPVCSSSKSESGSDDSSSSSGGVPSGNVKELLDKYGELAYNTGQTYHLPYVAILAQLAIESGWGASAPGNNFFGIKAGPNWNGPVSELQTQEDTGGGMITITDAFRKYDTEQDGFDGYGEFIRTNDIYQEAWNHPNDPKKYITELKNAGYATAGNYIPVLHGVIDNIEEEIANRNDSSLPPSEDVTFDPSKFDATVQNASSGSSSSDTSDTTTIGGGSAGGCCAKKYTKVTGGTNAEKMFNYLKEKMGSAEAAAGAVGNLMQESGGGTEDIKTDAVNPSSGAKGMIQWYQGRASRLDEIAAKKNKDWTDFDVQLYYMGWELGYEDDETYLGSKPTHTSVGGAMKGAKDLTEATKIWLETYEIPCVPGSCQHEMDLRVPFAEEIMSKYGDGASAVSGASTGGGNCESSGASGDFVHYLQGDPEWNTVPYGTGNIGDSGCGPTSVAMIMATKKDKSIKPPEVATLFEDNNQYVPGAGTSYGAYPVGADEYEMDLEILNTDWDALKKELEAGNLAVLSGQGAAPFTAGGHIVVARGVDSDGKIIVANPGRIGEDPAKTPYEIPMSGIKNIFVYK